MKKLKEGTHGCMFAHSSPVFEGEKDETVLCIVNGDTSYTESRKLLTSKNWFKDSEEPKLDGYKTVNGLAGLAGIQKFIVAAVKTRGTDEMALYVTPGSCQRCASIFCLLCIDMSRMTPRPGIVLNSHTITAVSEKMRTQFWNLHHTVSR